MAKELVIPKENKLNQWTNLIQEWKKSGLSQKEFCHQNNLKLSTFGRWRQRIKMKENKTGFVEVSLKQSSPATENLELIINDLVKIKLTQGFDEELLKKVIKVVRASL